MTDKGRNSLQPNCTHYICPLWSGSGLAVVFVSSRAVGGCAVASQVNLKVELSELQFYGIFFPFFARFKKRCNT